MTTLTAQALKDARDAQEVITVKTPLGTFQGTIERITMSSQGDLAVKLDTTNGWLYL